MKNGAECYKDFFGYFNALKTNSDTVTVDHNFVRHVNNDMKYGSPDSGFGHTLVLKYLIVKVMKIYSSKILRHCFNYE